MQIMGGESYMTENEIERHFRDSRINLIVEGANEVMQSFVFGYGGKPLAEQMVGVQERLTWNSKEGFGANVSRIARNALDTNVMSRAIPLGLELFLGIKKSPPRIGKVHPSLAAHAQKLCWLVREHSHQFKLASKIHEEKIIDRQCIQALIADNAIYIHAMACSLSRLDAQIRAGEDGPEFERDRAAALHFFELAEVWIRENWRRLRTNEFNTMRRAADAALEHNDTLPNKLFIVPERSPSAMGTGREPKQDAIKQFPGDAYAQHPEHQH
jgi:hypothetical protein